PFFIIPAFIPPQGIHGFPPPFFLTGRLRGEGPFLLWWKMILLLSGKTSGGNISRREERSGAGEPASYGKVHQYLFPGRKHAPQENKKCFDPMPDADGSHGSYKPLPAG
ncbi:hypothetical protein, partial [Akkermansia sp.]